MTTHQILQRAIAANDQLEASNADFMRRATPAQRIRILGQINDMAKRGTPIEQVIAHLAGAGYHRAIVGATTE